MPLGFLILKCLLGTVVGLGVGRAPTKAASINKCNYNLHLKCILFYNVLQQYLPLFGVSINKASNYYYTYCKEDTTFLHSVNRIYGYLHLV